MSDFVNFPLEKKLNKKNIFTRVKKLEEKTDPRPSAQVASLSELSQNLGIQKAGVFKCVDPNTGALRGYMAAVPQPEAKGYHLAFFNNAGVLQFGVDADDGSIVAGGGVFRIDADGTYIEAASAASSTRAYKFLSAAGNFFGFLYGLDGASDLQIQLVCNAINENKNASTFIEALGGVGKNATILIDALDGSDSGPVILLSAVSGGQHSIKINQVQSDVDVQIGSVASVDTLSINGATGNIGMNTTPHATIKADVSGDIRATTVRTDTIKTDTMSSTDLHITTGAGKTVVYDTAIYDDLNFSPDAAGGPAATLPDYVTINDVIHREFTSANNQLCGSVKEIPHTYKLSTTLYPHAHIFLKGGESAGTTGVTFTLYWELRQAGGVTSGSSVLSASSSDLAAEGDKLDVNDSTGFAGPSELGGQLAIKLARTAGNAGDVVVTTFGVHYAIDTPGSRTVTGK